MVSYLQTKTKKIFDFSMVSFLTCPVLVNFPPCLVTIGWDRKQGILRSRLEGANSWRLHRRQDRMKTAIRPKIRLNLWTQTNCLHFKVTLHLFSYLLLFKTNHSAHIVAPWDVLVRTSYIQLD